MDIFEWADSLPQIRLFINYISFNAAAVKALGSPQKIAVGFSPTDKNVFAVRPAQSSDELVYSFAQSGIMGNGSVTVSGVRLQNKIRPEIKERLGHSRIYSITAEKDANGKSLVFDITKAVIEI